MSDMFLNFSAYVEQQSLTPLVFGLQVSPLDTVAVAQRIASPAAHGHRGARVYVTPNIQHVSLMRRDGELRHAMATADLVTCDGFPVARYAKFRGCAVPGRVTGREVVDELLNRTDLSQGQRLFFLVDGAATAAAVQVWANEDAARPAVAIEIAPIGFGKDDNYCAALVDRVMAFDATMLFLGVGAPRSELFATRYRDRLPDGCWALCIGQSIKIALGLVTMPPAAVRALNVEWLWRMMLEPKRLLTRYCDGAVGFGLAVVEELSSAPSSETVVDLAHDRSALEVVERSH